MSDALRLTDVTAGYGSALALQSLSLDAPCGRVTGVVGPNGAGKTTLLRAISGVVPITRGEIVFAGARLSKRPPHRVVEAGVVHVPEGRRMLRGLSVLDNLRVGGLASGKRSREKLEFVLSVFPELEQHLRNEASRLSGGEQQMVAIGRGLMANPRMILVDEMSLGLAPRVVTRIAATLQRLASEQGIGVVVVDQSLEVLRKVSNFLVVLVNGKIVMSTDRPVVDFERARAAYLGGPDPVGSGDPVFREGS